MALPSRYGIDKKINSMAGLSAYENGGPGSGNFGHSGRPGEIGGSSKTGSYEQLSGPAKTRGEYMQKDASEDCKTEFSDVYGALSDHAYWIADEGGFADGYEARDYETLGDKYAGICDRSRSRGYVTQHDLVGMLKRTRKEAEPYGLIDGSGSTDKMNDFLVKYDMDDKLNSASDVFENGGKGSGNFGHSGRPGEVGGSGKGSGGSHSKNIDDEIEKTKKAIEGLGEFLGSIPPSGILSSEMEGIEKASKELEKARKKLEKLEKEKKGSGKKQSGEISLKGKSLYEKVHMIEPGDEVHITPKDNLPNFDRKIKVDYIQDGTIHYGSSETSDGYTYPAWAIKDITKIVRKKKNEVELNGGAGSGNFGHAGRPGEVGGSSKDGFGGSAGKYDVKDGKDAREYLTGGGKMQLISPEAFGFTYDAVGSPVRLSRFEKSADDKLWSAWASMQKVQDDKMIGDVTAEGLATAHDVLGLAKAVISTSQTAYLPSERKSAEAQTKKFVDGVKDEVKKAKIKLTADTKKYGDTEVRKATRKALDNISSAMDGFLGYENPSREYRD